MEYEYVITSAYDGKPLIGHNAMKTNMVHGKTFSYLLIGEWLKNIAQSISQRQQARCTQKLFTLVEW